MGKWSHGECFYFRCVHFPILYDHTSLNFNPCSFSIILFSFFFSFLIESLSGRYTIEKNGESN